MASIKHDEGRVQIFDAEIILDNGIVCRVRIDIDKYWDGSARYEIKFNCPPMVRFHGQGIYLEHRVPDFSIECHYDEEEFLHQFEEILFEKLMDCELEKYPESFGLYD